MSPRRPSRPGLTREYIVRTALEIIDRDGVAGLSMRKLGGELGADPMAVYYYLPNKSALFDGVVEAVYAEIDVSDLDAAAPWREQLATYMRRMRAAIRRHPNALPVLSTRPAYMPSMLHFGDRAVGVLERAGFSGATALDLINCLGTFTVGHVLAEVGEPVGGATATPEELAATLTGGSFPRLAAVFEAGYEYRPDAQYELGLRAMLDGFERLL